MRINFTHLKYFCDTAKYGSFSIAAKKNFISQSAVSQAIHKLEESLNKKLVVYNAKQFSLTKDGELVFSKSQNIFNALTDLETTLNYHEKEYCGCIEIACTHSFALGLLPKYLKLITEKYPLINFSFRLGHTDLIKKWLKNGSIDFGIVIDNEDLSGLDCYEILSGEYKLYSSKNYNKNITELKVLISEERPETNKLKDLYSNKFNNKLPILMEVSSWEVIANFAEVELGVGFIPDYVARRRKNILKELDLGLAKIPYKLFVVLRKDTKLTKNVDAIINLFQENNNDDF